MNEFVLINDAEAEEHFLLGQTTLSYFSLRTFNWLLKKKVSCKLFKKKQPEFEKIVFHPSYLLLY